MIDSARELPLPRLPTRERSAHLTCFQKDHWMLSARLSKNTECTGIAEDTSGRIVGTDTLGVQLKEDREHMAIELKNLTAQGLYKSPLWKHTK